MHDRRGHEGHAAVLSALGRAYRTGAFRARDDVEGRLLARADRLVATLEPRLIDADRMRDVDPVEMTDAMRTCLDLLEQMWSKGMGSGQTVAQRSALADVARILVPEEPLGTGPRIRWAYDVSAAEWVRTGIDWSRSDAAGVLPQCFPAYARILHPAWNSSGGPVRWAAIAEWSGASMHPEVWFDEISSPRPGHGQTPPPWNSDPDQAELPDEQLRTLCRILAAHTGSKHAWYCQWEGWGWLHGAMLRVRAYHADNPPPPDAVSLARPVPAFPPEILKGPKVRMPDFDRTYLLLEGPIDAAGEIGGWVDWGDTRAFEQQLPNIWWPDSRAWCIASEVDFEFTYVGGSIELIEELLSSAELEVQRTPLTTGA